MKRKLLLGLFIMNILSLNAQTEHLPEYDSLKVTFHFLPESDIFYTSYKGNAEHMKLLCEAIEARKNEITKTSTPPIKVMSYCSYFDTQKENLQSAKIRANRMKSVLISKCGLSESNFKTGNRSFGQALGQSIVEISIFIPKPIEEVKQQSPREEKVIDNNIAIAKQETVADKEPQQETPIVIEPVNQPIPRFTIRTNALYLAALIPDLGIEVALRDNASVILHGAYADWNWNKHERQLYFWKINPEVRHYFGLGKNFYAGAEYHMGKYNIRLNDSGYKGSFIGGGLTTGYVWRLNTNLSLDFNIGLGYTHLDYDKRVLGIFAHSKTKNVWGPSQAGIVLNWHPFK